MGSLTPLHCCFTPPLPLQGLSPLVLKYKEGQNPSAWMLDVLGGPQTAEPNYPDLAEEYCNSALYQVAKAPLWSPMEPPECTVCCF